MGRELWFQISNVCGFNLPLIPSGPAYSRPQITGNYLNLLRNGLGRLTFTQFFFFFCSGLLFRQVLDLYTPASWIDIYNSVTTPYAKVDGLPNFSIRRNTSGVSLELGATVVATTKIWGVTNRCQWSRESRWNTVHPCFSPVSPPCSVFMPWLIRPVIKGGEWRTHEPPTKSQVSTARFITTRRP